MDLVWNSLALDDVAGGNNDRLSFPIQNRLHAVRKRSWGKQAAISRLGMGSLILPSNDPHEV